MSVTEWYPECLPVAHPTDLDVVKEAAFVELERRVLDALTNTWCSADKARLLLALVVVTRPDVSVEIGAFTGSCTLPMLAGLQYLDRGRAYVVEPWSTDEAVRGLPDGEINTTWWGGLDMPAIRRQFEAMLERWSLAARCEVIAEPSRDAVSRVPPMDFLHLDGNFSEAGALADTELYLPRLVAGGYVLLSNVFVSVGGKLTKVKALWPLFDQCEIVAEVDDGNTLLFRKR
jgi:hypothetical protein